MEPTIDGISLETYAEVRAALRHANVRGEPAPAVLARRGLDPRRWARIDVGWRARMKDPRDVVESAMLRARYESLYVLAFEQALA